MTGFSDQFKLSITKALSDQLAEALDNLEPAPLTLDNLAELDRQAEREGVRHRSGVYQLHRNGHLVYIGKADKSLSERLRQHHKKISGRLNIRLEEMTFTCLFVDEDFSAVAPERLLINKHRSRGQIPWNGKGFGPKDPGRERDSTKLERDRFDVLYPINLNVTVTNLNPGPVPLPVALEGIKNGLPYNFRFEDLPKTDELELSIPDTELTADEAFRLIAREIPHEWKITALLGYVIMYPDQARTYDVAFRYYRSGGTVEDVEPTTKPVGRSKKRNRESTTDDEIPVLPID